MNTILSRSELIPSWSVVFCDGSHASSQADSWADFSDLVMRDGVLLHLSDQKISQIVVTRAAEIFSLKIDVPEQCFGFHRWRQPVGGQDPLWIYSAFGFFQEEQRIILRVTEESGYTLIQKRDTNLML